MDTNLKGCAQF